MPPLPPFSDYHNHHRKLPKKYSAITNLSKNLDITEFMKPETLSISSEEKSNNGLSSTNKSEFDIELLRHHDTVEISDLIDFFKTFHFTGSRYFYFSFKIAF